MNGFYDKVTQLLLEAGFSFLRPGKGSHQTWSNGKIKVTVSTNCKSRHTANAILKAAKLNKRL